VFHPVIFIDVKITQTGSVIIFKENNDDAVWF
jgi:hypothetical protein